MSAVTASTFLLKQPSETRNYIMDFTNLLGTDVISSVTSVSHTLRGGDTSDLVLGTASVIGSGMKVAFNISSGTHYNTYRVAVLVTTIAGQTLEGDGMLIVSNI